MNRKTTSITHGAITAALTVIVIMLDRVLAGFLMTFVNMPLIIYGLYYSTKETFLTYIVTVLLVMIVPGQLPTTILMISYGLVGVAYVYMNKKDISNALRFLFVSLANGINYLIMMKFFGSFFGMEFNLLLVETQTMLKLSNETTVLYMTIFILITTILLETFIIFMTANYLSLRMKKHR